MGRGIVFRCDFGGTRGWGHVVRCSALAKAAKAAGLRTALVSQAALEDLPAGAQGAFDRYVSINQTIPTASFWERFCPPDSEWGCVVLDQYDYARREINMLKQALILSDVRLAVIDDEAKRDLTSADLVLNHILGATPALYPGCSEVLAGEQYALIRPGFGEADCGLPEVDQLDNSAIIMFGGTDPRNLSGACVRFLWEAAGDRYQPVLVRTRQIAFKDEIERELRKFKKSAWIENVTSGQLAHCFREGKICVTACGGSVYEAAYCNIPFIGVVVAPNQERMAEAIERQWGLPVLRAESIDRKRFSVALDRLEARIKELNRKGKAYSNLDGNGPSRVIERIAGMLKE